MEKNKTKTVTLLIILIPLSLITAILTMTAIKNYEHQQQYVLGAFRKFDLTRPE